MLLVARRPAGARDGGVVAAAAAGAASTPTDAHGILSHLERPLPLPAILLCVLYVFLLSQSCLVVFCSRNTAAGGFRRAGLCGHRPALLGVAIGRPRNGDRSQIETSRVKKRYFF